MTALPLFVGLSGRVGRLIRPFLPEDLPVADRQPEPGGLAWDLLAGAGPLRALAERSGAPPALVVLSGTTPATGTDMDLNRALGVAAMAAAVEAGVGRVLLASSAAVCGPPRAAPWRETDPVAPTGAYGRAKLAMELAAEPFRAAGLEVCALRIGNVAGADALLLNAPGPIRLDRFADGTGPVRSYIGPATLARLLLALALTPGRLPPVLNLAAPGAVAMRDLAEAAGLPWAWVPAPPEAVPRQVLDLTSLALIVPLDDTEGLPEILVAQWHAARVRP